jgi:citrate lyase subunit beta / citryl-CoA lyase
MPNSALAPRPRIAPGLARSWLLASAANESAIAAALTIGADAVVIDLEDGVAAHRKEQARASLGRWFDGSRSLWVRINDATTADWALDLEVLAGLQGLAGVILAKTESADEIASTTHVLGAEVPLVALIESARGLINASAIAASPGTLRLAFGTGDFRRDTGISDAAFALAYARSQLVIASAAARIAPPIDGPTPGGSPEQVSEDARHSGAMGMSGKLCLTPAHVAPINREFSPDPEELRAARALLDAPPSALDGSYPPRRARAEALVERATQLGLG